jgi:formimidoylglutamase
MNFLQKPSVQIYEPQQDTNDLRVSNIIKPGPSNQPADIGIIGVPFDKAVSLGGGRSGAGLAPAKVREALKKYGTTFNIEQKIDISDLNIVDFGDVAVTEDIAETHERITSTVFGLLTKGILPIVIGGGHDISIGTVRALSKFHSRQIGGINIDAHFDVREIIDDRITSGTPFRRLLDLGLLEGENFVEMGAHDNLNSRVYYEYLMSKKVTVFTLSEVAKTGTSAIMEKALKISNLNTGSVFVSIDIDSVAQCYAPGCSAPDASGFTPEQIREFSFLAGASKDVKLLDIVEINPMFDVDNRTARLVASIIISFLNGFKIRGN